MTGIHIKPAADSANPGEQTAHLSKRKRILIAESDGFTRMVLMLLFRMIGFSVDFTSNGIIALGKLRGEAPDVLLVELNLSGLSGLELLRWARGVPRSRNMRVYVFTHVESIKRALRREVMMSATRVFDKASMTRENVVKSIIADLNQAPPGKMPDLIAEVQPEPEMAGATLLPGELDEIIGGVRAQSEVVLNCKGPETKRYEGCRELVSRVCSLRSCAEVGGLRNLVRQATALEGLLNHLCRDRKPIASSTLNVVGRAVEVLDVLGGGNAASENNLTPFNAVVIDESPVSGKSLCDALSNAAVKSVLFQDAAQALKHLASNWANLIIVNVRLPEKHGLDLPKLRQLPLHSITPVIFVSRPSTGPVNPFREARPGAPAIHSHPLLRQELVVEALNHLHGKPPGPRKATAEPPHPSPSAPLGYSLPVGPEALGYSQPQVVKAEPGGFWPTSTRNEREVSDNPLELSALTSALDRGADIIAADLSCEMTHENSGDSSEEGLPEAPADLFAGTTAQILDSTASPDPVQAASSLEPDTVAEEPPPSETFQVPQVRVSESEMPAWADQEPLSAPAPGPEWLSSAPPNSSEPAAPAGNNFELEGSDYRTAPGKDEEAFQALERECAMLREAAERQKMERESLVNRIFTSENELHRAQAELEQKNGTLEILETQLADLKRQQPAADVLQRLQELERRLAERTSDLERARAELAKQAKAHAAAESELRRHLEAAQTSAQNSEAAQEEARERVAQLEQELAAARGNIEELNSRMTAEQALGAEAAKRARILEKELSERVVELELAREEAAQNARTHAQVESGLRKDLEAAHVAARQNEAAQKEAAQKEARSRVAQLEQELAAARQAGEELNCRIGREQQLRAGADQRIKELEKESSERSAALERASTEAELKAKAHAQAEADFRRQLEAAQAAAKKSETSQQEAQARVTQLERELAASRKNTEELNSRIAKEQQLNAEAGKRAQDLQAGINQAEAELQRARADAAEKDKAHTQAESDLRRQLESACAASKQSEAAQKQAETRVTQLEQETAAARRSAEEAISEAAQRAKELERVTSQQVAALEKAKAEADQKSRLHEQAEADSRRQLESACAASKRSEAAQKEAETRVAHLEKEVAAARQSAEEAVSQAAKERKVGAEAAQRAKELEQVSSQQAAALEKAKAEADQKSRLHEQAEADLQRQLESACAASKQNEAAQKEAQARVTQLEQEVAAARRSAEEAVSQAAQRAKELEQVSRQQAAALDKAKAEADQKSRLHAQAESELRRDLEAATARAKQTEAAQKEAELRATRLEKELAGMRQSGEELNARIAKEQQLRAQAGERAKELQSQLQSETAARQAEASELGRRIDESAAALARTTAELKKANAQRQRSEEHASILASQIQELQSETARLVQDQRAGQQRINELETLLRQRDEAIARNTADLQKTREVATRVRKNISFFEAAHGALNTRQQDLQSRLEAALNATHETGTKLLQESAERQRLAAALQAAQRNLQAQSQKGETLEAELQGALQALRQTEARAAQVEAERQNLNEELASAQLSLSDRAQRAELELSKLQAALQFEQVERKRRETQIARMRHISLQATRGARSLRKTVQSQAREPVDHLEESARSLLQTELGEEQKKLAQAILQQAATIKTRLRDPEIPSGDAVQPHPSNEHGAENGSTYIPATSPAAATSKQAEKHNRAQSPQPTHDVI